MPTSKLTDEQLRERERQALEYVSRQLGDRAPKHVRLEGEFDEQPLEGEGRTLLFSFELPAAASIAARCTPQTRHYVAVGETEPNYFPAYELMVDDAYSFHIGTRFMLVMGVQLVDPTLAPPGLRETMRRFVQHYARGATIRHEELAALFRSAEAYFAVYRLTLNDDDVYCMVGDCPPGFRRLAHYPPQVALRLHLGHAIRNDARAEHGG